MSSVINNTYVGSEVFSIRIAVQATFRSLFGESKVSFPLASHRRNIGHQKLKDPIDDGVGRCESHDTQKLDGGEDVSSRLVSLAARRPNAPYLIQAWYWPFSSALNDSPRTRSLRPSSAPSMVLFILFLIMSPRKRDVAAYEPYNIKGCKIIP